ncbi:hypothetical protein D6D54_07670 [Spiroplasma poulsonii]|uniref:Uncharacterized protein n=1 Tax=Spiroplasma poulsonii TaxID=2138 RepID=A0A3S0UAG8_9MOLU|nr:hypothetical protein [Spiroplasma poulsonii]MBW3059292.1 hypothetical protein [Spiroplasma poulsonii]RUP75908.1 hypothetical protein D6D54_07670 [Spiroplasma poulsonii]
MAKENLFKSNLNLNKSEKLAETLLGVRENIKTINSENVTKTINKELQLKPNQPKLNKKYLNLSIRPDKIEKIKNIANEYNLSVSALLEQIIDQL